GWDRGLHFVFRLVTLALIFIPIIRQVAHHWLLTYMRGAFLSCLNLRLDRIGSRFRIFNSSIFGVDLPQRRMLLDRLVQQRLGDGGIIDFTMPMTPVSDQ